MKKFCNDLSDEVPLTQKATSIQKNKTIIEEKLHKTVHTIREINERLVFMCSELKCDQFRSYLKSELTWSHQNNNTFVNSIRSYNIEKLNQYTINFSKLEESLRQLLLQFEKYSFPEEWNTADLPFLKSIYFDTPSLAVPESIFPSDPNLREVFDFIEKNYHQPIGLREVAQAVGYSSTYLTDLVRRQTGESVHRWIIKRRMVEACSLLEETNQPVNQIAQAVGYQDASYFSRHFRQIYAVPPKAWRERHSKLISSE